MIAFAVTILAKATLVIGVALAGARLAHNSRAAVRHLVLASAFVVLLVLPLASIVAPPVPVAVPVAAATGFVVSPPDAIPEVTAIGSPASADTAAAPALSHWPRPTLSALAAAAWLGGTLIFLLPVSAGLWQMRTLRRAALPWRHAQAIVDRLAHEARIRRRVDAVVQESIPGPMTCGFVRPAIVLPADAQTWTQDDLGRAIVHELEHVRRGDAFSRCVARVACACYWFHPAVWIAWRQLNLEAERACDDAVLRRAPAASTTDADSAAYADQLVGLARRLSSGSSSPLLAMANRHDLTARVRALLDARQRRGPAGTRWIVLAGGVAVLFVTTMSPLRIVAVAKTQQAAGPQAAPGVGRFDAATIKPCSAEEAPPGPARGGMGGTNASFSRGRMAVPCVTLEQLIYLAYAGPGTWPDNQLINVTPGGASDSTKVRGGPAWVHSQHTKFAVEATSAGASERNVLLGSMLRSLIEERFHLKIHRETEDVPMFTLKVAKGGLKIKPMQPGDCDEYQPDVRPELNAAKPTCGSLVMLGHGPNTRWTWGQAKLQALAYRLSGALGEFVIDQTGVTDDFIIRLEFHPDDNTPGIRWADQDADTSVPEAASIFTALEQQIGVKVEKTRGPRGYLVIDHVEPLTAGR
jgi:bla regulator protein BlaR1